MENLDHDNRFRFKIKSRLRRRSSKAVLNSERVKVYVSEVRAIVGIS